MTTTVPHLANRRSWPSIRPWRWTSRGRCAPTRSECASSRAWAASTISCTAGRCPKAARPSSPSPRPRPRANRRSGRCCRPARRRHDAPHGPACRHRIRRGAPAGPQPRRTRPGADSRGAPLGPRGAGTRRSRTLRLFVPAPQSIKPGPVPEKTGRAFLPIGRYSAITSFSPRRPPHDRRVRHAPGEPGTAPASGCGPKARNTRWPSGTQMRHNSREYAGVSLDIPIFNRRAARNDISKAQLAVRSQ